MASGTPATQRARAGEPQAAPTAQHTENVAQKRDLTSWWRQFKRNGPKGNEERGDYDPSLSIYPGSLRSTDSGSATKTNGSRSATLDSQRRLNERESVMSLTNYSIAEETGIFGVPLQTSIRYANVAISLFDADGNSYIYGYVPIVVAKCGVFLKEKGKISPCRQVVKCLLNYLYSHRRRRHLPSSGVREAHQRITECLQFTRPIWQRA